MISQGDILEAVFAWLQKEVAHLPLFQCVPPKVSPPYGVMKIKEMHPGNGLPFPHFYTEGTLVLQLWSAYQGVGPLAKTMGQVKQALLSKAVPCRAGLLQFDVRAEHVTTQLRAAQKKWREGEIQLHFCYHNRKEKNG